MVETAKPHPMPRPVAVFTLAYLAVATPWAWASGNTEFIIYIVIMALLCGVVMLVHRRVGLSAGLLWCLSAWGLLHMAGGLVPPPDGWPLGGDYRTLYNLWLLPIDITGDGQPDWFKYDQIVHAFGFGVTTWLCWQGLRSAVSPWTGGQTLRPTLGLMTLSVAAGVGFGAFNEVIEFFTTLVTDTNVGGYVNTGWDLVFNTAGALIAVCIIRFGGRN